jgi:hypothetical protein
VDPQRRAAAVARLWQLREADQLTSAHVRLAASGLGVAERSVWWWLGDPGGERGQRPGRFWIKVHEAVTDSTHVSCPEGSADSGVRLPVQLPRSGPAAHALSWPVRRPGASLKTVSGTSPSRSLTVPRHYLTSSDKYLILVVK